MYQTNYAPMKPVIGFLSISGVPNRNVIALPVLKTDPTGNLVPAGNTIWYELNGTPIALPLPAGQTLTIGQSSLLAATVI
jgi:hypothetical protein